MKISIFLKNDLVTLLFRLLIAIVVVWILRCIFYVYNTDLLHIENWKSELPSLLKGSFILDASNLAFTFSLFVVLSLLPFKFRSKKTYQAILFVCFMLGIIVLVILNLADTIYFHYASKRITIDEFTYSENDNTPLILLKSMGENWYLLLIGIGLIIGAVWTYRKIKYNATPLKKWIYYTVNSLIFLIALGVAVVAVRGGVGRAIRPITLSNAAQFAESPIKSYIVLNNPFCIIKTLNKDQTDYTRYFSEPELDSLYYPVHRGLDKQNMKRENVVIFILESFSYEHSAYLNPALYPDGVKYTPFLDSLMQQGFIFDKCYANGKKSIDALPSVLVSIPSFKTPFALTQQALSPLNGFGTLLGNEGWDSWFFNGSERRSMGFVAFAKSAGYKNFRTREDYEKKHGTDDFDGYWGIWDEQFLQYMAHELGNAKEPFLTTTFTLSSHHPFVIPDKYKNILPKGKTKAQQCVAYTDMALRKFFQIAQEKNWYKNTLFVFVADHVSPEVYAPENKTGIGNSHIMYFLYTPDGSIQGRDATVTQQIDIMPTVLGLLDYNKPYFAFGKDHFGEQSDNFAINYNGSAFQWITDSTNYIFDEKTTGNPVVDQKVKAFVQRYYLQMEKRKFTLE